MKVSKSVQGDLCFMDLAKHADLRTKNMILKGDCGANYENILGDFI